MRIFKSRFNHKVERKWGKYENTGESKHNDILRNLPLQVEKCGTKAKWVREKKLGCFLPIFNNNFCVAHQKKKKNTAFV